HNRAWAVGADPRELFPPQHEKTKGAHGEIGHPPAGTGKIRLRPIQPAKSPDRSLATLGALNVFVRGWALFEQAPHLKLIAQIITNREADLHPRGFVLRVPAGVDLV